MQTESTTVAEMSRSPWSGRGRLDQLVAELERQKESRLDFVAARKDLMVNGHSQRGLRIVPGTPRAQEWMPLAGLDLTPSAIGQLFQSTSPAAPVKFGRELAEARADLAADLVDGLWRGAEESRQLIRCLDGKVRAVLSGKYRVLDNHDLAFAALDAVKTTDGEIVECTLSDNHMRLKFTSRSIWEAIDTARREPRGGWYSGGLGSQEWLSRVHARSGGDLPGGQAGESGWEN